MKEKTYEFTPQERIFQKRFEAFAAIQQPPPLSYDDYLQGSDFSKVSQIDLINSTAECFNTSKTIVDKLLSQASEVDEDFLPIQESELRQLAKVFIGNSVYVLKLRQKVENNNGKADISVEVDLDTHSQFCTIKIS